MLPCSQSLVGYVALIWKRVGSDWAMGPGSAGSYPSGSPLPLMSFICQCPHLLMHVVSCANLQYYGLCKAPPIILGVKLRSSEVEIGLKVAAKLKSQGHIA